MVSLMNLTADTIGLSYTELMLTWNSDLDGAAICVRIVLLIVYFSDCFFWFIWGGACFAYDKIVINQWFSIFLARGPSFIKECDGPHCCADTSWRTSRILHIGQWTFYQRFMELSVLWVGEPPGARWESLS